MVTVTSHSQAETSALGEELGRLAEPGWVFGLTGELGSGKTHLIQGLARGLGIVRRVQSPTFALVNEHAGGRLRLFHLDLYRLDTMAQIQGAGLEDYFFPRDAVSVIEWFERWQGALPPMLCRLQLRHAGGSTRVIEYALPRA